MPALNLFPMVNPVERFWEDRKGRIDVIEAQVRSSLTAWQKHVADIVQRYPTETMASLTGYSYLVEAIHALSL